MKYLEQAISAHQSGNAALAEQLYQKQLNEVPNEHNAMQLYGLLKMSTNRLEEGAALMKQSLDIEPGQPHVWNNLGSCLKKLNRNSDAISAFQRAISEKDDFVPAYKNLIYLYMHLGDDDNLWKLATELKSKLPSNNEAMHLFGKAANFIGKHGLAIETFASLPLDGDGGTLKHDLGIAYRLNGEPQRALECFEAVYKSHPSNASVLHNLGNAHSDLNNVDEAASFFKKAIDINPDYAESHKNLSTLLWKSGNKADFLNSYKARFSSGQITTPLLLSYIEQIIFSEDYGFALEELKQYEKFLEGSVDFYVLKSRCYTGLRDVDSAVESLKFGIAINDSIIAPKLELAKLYFENHQYDLALQGINKVLEEVPSLEEAQNLAKACQQKVDVVNN